MSSAPTPVGGNPASLVYNIPDVLLRVELSQMLAFKCVEWMIE